MVVKHLLRVLLGNIRLLSFQERWRKNNSHNATSAGNIFPEYVVSVDNNTYGVLNIHYYKDPKERLVIGKYCSIANNVHFFLGGEHDYKTISTFPFKNRVSKNRISEARTKGTINIGDDVWIGYGTIVLSGSTIGRGAVIGAGSVVSGYVPPYSIYVGNQVKKYRFSDDVISKLNKFDFSKLNWEKIDGNYDWLYTRITDDNVDDVIKKVEELF